MKLHIRPTWNPDYVTLTEEPDIIGTPVAEPLTRSRDLIFGSLDLIRYMYDDVILHLEP